MAELDQLYDKTSALEDDVTHSSCRALTELRNEANNQRPDVHVMLTAIKTISRKIEAWCQAVEDLTISYSQNPAVAVPVNVAKLDQMIGSAQDGNSAEVKHKGDVTLVIANSHKQANKENEGSPGEPNSCTGVIQTTPNHHIVNAITRSQLSLVTSWFDCDNQIETSLRTALDKLLASFRQSQGSATTDRSDDSNDWWISGISDKLSESKKSRDAEKCWTDIHHKLVEAEKQLRERDSERNSHLLEVFESLNPAVDTYNSFHEGRCQFQSKLQHSMSRPAVLRATNEVTPQPQHQKPQRKYYAIKLTTVDTFVKEEIVCISPAKHSEPMTAHPVTSANGDVTEAPDDSNSTNGHINGDHPHMTCDSDDENFSSPAVKLTSSDDDVNESSQKDASCDRRDSVVNGNGFTAEDDDINFTEPNEQSTTADHDVNESSQKDTSCDRRDSVVNGNGFTAVDDDVNSTGPNEQPTASVEHRDQTSPVDQTDSQNGSVTPAGDDETSCNGSMKNGTRFETVEADQLTSVSHEESVKFLVKSVIDPRNGKEVTIDQAVRDGIVDHRTGQYINPATGESCPIGEAMNDGRIRIERVVTTSRTAEERRSVGLITIRVQTDTTEYDIKGAIDLATGQTLTADEARKRNIVDEASGTFLNTKTGEKMPLSDAVDAGHVIADFDAASSQAPCETKTYAVCGVVDQVERKPVPFPEAVKRGLIDRHTGCYINNVTGERVFAGDAVKRGLFKCRAVEDSSTFDEIDESNRVVADRIQHVRSNVLRNMKILSALKKSAVAK